MLAVDALVKGGVSVVELTFTTPGVENALRRVREAHGASAKPEREHPDPRQVELAHSFGAELPRGAEPSVEVLAATLDTGLPSVPGVFRPSEVSQALDIGAEVVELFPASTGGIDHFKALLGPFPGLDIVPTGGVGLGNIARWLSAGAFAVGVGGELCSQALIRAGDWSEITSRARRFTEAVHAAEDPNARRSGSDEYRCSFCGLHQDQVGRLVAGPGGVYICDKCIEMGRKIIAEEESEGRIPRS